jgi:hypothetical protein
VLVQEEGSCVMGGGETRQRRPSGFPNKSHKYNYYGNCYAIAADKFEVLVDVCWSQTKNELPWYKIITRKFHTFIITAQSIFKDFIH